MTTNQTAQIYDRLRGAILSLELMPGERLTERGLEGAFAASRTPVRAALLRLETEGLVQRGDRGFSVAPIDVSEIGWVAELRAALEPQAARLAIARATDDDIAHLAELVRAHEPHDRGATEAPTRGAFHERLADLSGNPLIADAVRGALTRIERTRWLDVRSPQTRERAWEEHRAIAAAIAARDADSAARLVEVHIVQTNERLVEYLGREHLGLRARGLAIRPAAGTQK
jgi:DNA-binding GntR family transcriptional regulator